MGAESYRPVGGQHGLDQLQHRHRQQRHELEQEVRRVDLAIEERRLDLGLEERCIAESGPWREAERRLPSYLVVGTEPEDRRTHAELCHPS